MASLPRPLIAVLVATLAAFAMWYVELKPSSKSSNGGSSQGLGQYQGAINKAHQAVATSNAANAKLGAPTSTAPVHTAAGPSHTTATAAKTSARTAPKTAVKTTAATATAVKTNAKPTTKTATAAKTAAKPSPAAMSTAAVATVQQALQVNKVVAILFYNGAASDDRAVKQELSTIKTDGSKVVKVAVPLSQLTKFSLITEQIPVVTAPTFVVINAAKQATSITGFADTLQIQQLIDDALPAKS
jgi:hypothetical protein